MKREKASIRNFCMTIMLLILSATGLYAEGPETPFPTYGTGAIQVRIYTDYFCPPCRGMEPAVEPLLRDLIKRNVIRLTLVDMPAYRHSALYARYFLYALKAKNDLEQALKVRNILFDAAARDEITKKEGIEELFRSKEIPYTAFEPKPAFDRFNALIKEDIIPATPTCVVIRAGKKEKFIGGPEIINVLKVLNP
jgi:protein-disulfide isomerase